MQSERQAESRVPSLILSKNEREALRACGCMQDLNETRAGRRLGRLRLDAAV